MRNKLLLLSLVFVLALIPCVRLNVSADFTDDFSDNDYRANGWETRLLFGKPSLDIIFPSEGRLSFHMPDYNTAIYMLNQGTESQDSTVEVTFENVFSAHGEVGLICRYHEDSWYELRAVLSGQYAGSYKLYKYDAALLAEKKNPFVSLHPDLERFYTRDIKVGRNAKNTISMICEGETIRILINGNEQKHLWNEELKLKEYTDGINGFSVWTETPYGLAQIDALNFRSFFENE